MQREDLAAGEVQAGDEPMPVTASEQSRPFTLFAGESLPLELDTPDRRYRVIVVSPTSP